MYQGQTVFAQLMDFFLDIHFANAWIGIRATTACAHFLAMISSYAWLLPSSHSGKPTRYRVLLRALKISFITQAFADTSRAARWLMPMKIVIAHLR